MERVHVLATLGRKILQEYSRRTTTALRAALPLRLVLPHLEPFLALNVAKEVRKDALVIGRAGEAVAAGRPAGREALQQLLEATKEIDRAFLARVGAFPVGIVIRYEEIAPVRMRRMERLLEGAYRILDAWRQVRGVRAAVRASYPRAELEEFLRELLQLYARETQLLSRSVRLPALLIPAREIFAQRLFTIMNDAAARLAGDLARTVYRPDRGDERGRAWGKSGR